MGLRKEALAGGGGGNAAAGKDGKMTISSICSFLQDEWRAHEAAKNQWHKERKTIMGRVAELEKQCGTLKGAVAMYERRMQMLENVLRKERGYPPVELPELPELPQKEAASPPLAPLTTLMESPPGASLPLPPSEPEMEAISLGSTPPPVPGPLGARSDAAPVQKDLFGAKAGGEAEAAGRAQAESAVGVAADAGEAMPAQAGTSDAEEAPEEERGRPRTYNPPNRSAAAARPPSPPPNFLRSAGVLDAAAQDPEELYQRQVQREAAAAASSSAAPRDGESVGAGPVGKSEVEGEGKTAPGKARSGRRALQAVLESRAAGGGEPDGEKEKEKEGERAEEAGRGEQEAAGGRPRASGKVGKTATRFRASIGSGFASNVGAGFQSGGDSSGPAGHTQSPGSKAGRGGGSGSGGSGVPKGGPAQKTPGAGGNKVKRPPPLKKPPDADEEILRLAVDLGIWTDDSPRGQDAAAAVAAASAGAVVSGTEAGRPDEVAASPVSPSAAGPVEATPPERVAPGRQRSRESMGGTPPSSGRRVSDDFNWVCDAPELSPKSAGSRTGRGGGTRATRDGAAFWHRRQPLRSHLSPVWGMSLSWDAEKGDNSLTLLSASEDATVKLWSLSGSLTDLSGLPASEAAGLEVVKDVEPRVTLRGHDGAVTCVGLNARDGLAYSGGIDGTIKVWTLPQPPFGLYSEYGAAHRQLSRTLECHTDALWGLAVQPSNPRRFVSASADGSLRLWDTSLSRPNLRSYMMSPGGASGAHPVAVCFPPALDTSFNTFFLAGFSGGQVARFDIATGEAASLQEPAGVQGPVTALAIAPVTPHTVFAAYADGLICRFDAGRSPGTSATIAPAHEEEGCSALAVAHDGLTVATGGPSGAVSLWDARRLDSPLHTAGMHHSRAGEGCLALEFAPPPAGKALPGHTTAVLASAGADGVVQMMALPSAAPG
eukprot:jgi/Tetstr1/431746/TSEL_002235.t2